MFCLILRLNTSYIRKPIQISVKGDRGNPFCSSKRGDQSVWKINRMSSVPEQCIAQDPGTLLHNKGMLDEIQKRIRNLSPSSPIDLFHDEGRFGYTCILKDEVHVLARSLVEKARHCLALFQVVLQEKAEENMGIQNTRFHALPYFFERCSMRALSTADLSSSRPKTGRSSDFKQPARSEMLRTGRAVRIPLTTSHRSRCPISRAGTSFRISSGMVTCHFDVIRTDVMLRVYHTLTFLRKYTSKTPGIP